MKKNIPFTNIPLVLLLVLFAGTTLSCKKLLDIPPTPPGEIPSSAIFSDSIDVMSAMAGIYNVVPNYETLTAPYTGLASDEFAYGGYASGSITELFTGSVTSSNGSVGIMWSNAYAPLYQINACLEGVGGSPTLETSLTRQLLGELRVLRSLYYFHLVNLFGGVPPVTSTAYLTNQAMPRTTADSIYGLILSDLDTATTLLTPAYPSSGNMRPNLYVAQALLAKVFLYRGQWVTAANMASSVINSGMYNLAQDLTKVFLDGSSEAIWQLPLNYKYSQSSMAYVYVPSSSSVVPNYYFNSGLLNAFEAGDKRMTNWVGINTVTANGTTTKYYYPFKVKNRAYAATPLEDNMVLRLGDTYLIRAEALAQQNKLDSARSDLNQIRSRAGLAATTAVTQQDLLTAIWHERQVELFGEWNNRWFDLKRTGTIDAVLGPIKSNWKSTQAIFPVPIGEIQNNSFLSQNAGY